MTEKRDGWLLFTPWPLINQFLLGAANILYTRSELLHRHNEHVSNCIGGEVSCPYIFISSFNTAAAQLDNSFKSIIVGGKLW